MNCGAIASRTFGRLGSAGGHRSAARAEIHLDKIREVLAGDLSYESVEQFLLQSLEVPRQRRPGGQAETKRRGVIFQPPLMRFRAELSLSVRFCGACRIRRCGFFRGFLFLFPG